MQTVGLRYFNVFGPRQDPNGPYAAVIPRWIAALAKGEKCEIYGDGETSRDFCYVANVVQANLRAATVEEDPTGVYNIAVGGKTSLNQIYVMIRERVAHWKPEVIDLRPEYRAFREGDIRDSQADVGPATSRIGYRPSHEVAQGMALTVAHFVGGGA